MMLDILYVFAKEDNDSLVSDREWEESGVGEYPINCDSNF